jgi:opacity protein-like surface antigen
MAVGITVLLLLIAPVVASAEGFLDGFIGASFTQKSDGDLTADGQTLTFTDQEFKTSLIVGGRAGWWFGLFGINLDVSWFRPELDPDEVTVIDPPFTLTAKSDLNVVGIGLNAMLRGQFIKDSNVPAGRLQPYVFAGPTLFISTFDLEATLTQTGVGTISAEDSDTDVRLGVSAGAGVTYLFTPHIGVFAEYRFTHQSPEFKLADQKVEFDLNTHHLLAGVSFRF